MTKTEIFIKTKRKVDDPKRISKLKGVLEMRFTRAFDPVPKQVRPARDARNSCLSALGEINSLIASATARSKSSR